MNFLTQYHYEKIWHKVNEVEVLELLTQEFKEGDAKGTLAYIKSTCGTGKTITVGESRFKEER